jgi:hypothetical protein
MADLSGAQVHLTGQAIAVHLTGQPLCFVRCKEGYYFWYLNFTFIFLSRNITPFFNGRIKNMLAGRDQKGEVPGAGWP